MVMATVVYADESCNPFDAILYQNQHPNNQLYFQNQVNNFSNTLTDLGRSFITESKVIHDQIYSSVAAAAARAALRASAGMFQMVIRPLNEIDEFRAASVLMQRWVMANPEIRNLYHRQECAGYDGSYVDMFPKDKGEDHYDYRRVMSGVVVDTKDGSYARHYLDDLVEGDAELTHNEKVDILSTWDIMNMYIKAGKEDPTDPMCGNL